MNAIGVYGVGVMGRGLALNLASKGHRVAIFNKEPERMIEVLGDARKEDIHTISGYMSIREFMASLQRPKKVLVMVPAGRAISDVISSMSPYLHRGDIIVDGGNELYVNTQQRQAFMRVRHQAELVGMGVSGGAHGARWGAAFMPGGKREAVEQILPFLRDMSDPHSEVAYVGEGGSGHFVKMVHNGIEYAIMQVIAEVYSILRATGMSNAAIADAFDECNAVHSLESYLLEITAAILRKPDEDGYLVDKILDVPRMNGTGAWTAKESFDSLVSCPTIIAAIDARIIASAKDVRVRLASGKGNRDLVICKEDVMRTMVFVFYMAYIQGFELIRTKSAAEQWGIDTSKLAMNWMGGCIIRSRILKTFVELNPLLDWFANRPIDHVANVVATCALYGLHTPVISATYQYILGYTTANCPANIIQAQRDFFGSHGYERIDKPGQFHTSDWV